MENQQAQSNRVKNLDNYTLQTELHQGKKKITLIEMLYMIGPNYTHTLQYVVSFI